MTLKGLKISTEEFDGYLKATDGEILFHIRQLTPEQFAEIIEKQRKDELAKQAETPPVEFNKRGNLFCNFCGKELLFDDLFLLDTDFKRNKTICLHKECAIERARKDRDMFLGFMQKFADGVVCRLGLPDCFKQEVVTKSLNSTGSIDIP
jgi:hypothetical protein